MWQRRDIPRDLGWTILVIISKDNTYTQEIGMLKLLWKVVEAIIDTPMRESVRLHDILHGFRAGRGNETRIFGVKLVQ